MKIRTEETATIQRIKVQKLCDDCGKDITYGAGRTLSDDNHVEFKLELSIGNTYPESGSGELECLDLCGICAPVFIQKIKDFGYKVNKEEWSY